MPDGSPSLDILATQVVRLLTSRPLPLAGGEKKLQEAISDLLDEAGLGHEREVRLSPEDVVDFMVEGCLAVEVKVKAPRRDMHRQCRRYCGHEAVRGLVLASATATGFPAEILGKPCWTASLGRAWL